MNTAEKNKLKHDFFNSIIIINNMTKSVSSFVSKISKCAVDEDLTNQKQLGIFLNSMNTIREQTSKIENIFQIILNE